MLFMRSTALSTLMVLAALLGGASAVKAEDAALVTAPAPWAQTLKFYGNAEGGIAFNTASPANNENFGSLFTDKSNQPQLNQLVLTAERPIDSTSSKFDFGFKLQALFGTDARYTHSLAELDHLIHSKNQLQVNDATVSMHMPVVFDGGVDVKVGQFVSPMSAETIVATGDSLYSHSYIFNFGVPMKHTGFLSVAHVNPIVDLYGGLDTGMNGGITAQGDMNHTVKGEFGFVLNLLGGDMTIQALSHIGAENPPNLFPGGGIRYVNDITTTYKATDKLTLTTDVNYIEDDGIRAIGYGVAQYAAYTLNDQWSLIGRGEVWRDNGNAFVGAYPGYFDNANAQRGLSNTFIAAPHATTYSELTLGANYKPDVPKSVEGLVIRPELRVDHSLNGTKPFNAGKDGTSFTPAVDVVVPF